MTSDANLSISLEDPVASFHARFSLTEKEYIEAQRLYVRAKQRRSIIVRWVLIVVFAVGFAVTYFSTPADAPKGSPMLVIAPVGVLFMLLLPWLQLRNFKRRFKVERSIFEDVSVVLDDYGYHSSSAAGEGRIAWSAFDGFLEGPLTIEFLRGFVFFPMPKRAFAATELERLIPMLESHLPRIGRKPKARSGTT